MGLYSQRHLSRPQICLLLYKPVPADRGVWMLTRAYTMTPEILRAADRIAAKSVGGTSS